MTRRSVSGFTLLEMLVVLVIIGLIAGLVGPRLFTRMDVSKVQTAQAQIKLLRGALETYRLDVGVFPSNEQGLRVLNFAPDEAVAKAKWKGPYLDGDVPLDPWGLAYLYQVPGPDGRGFYIWSYGADSKPGGESNDADIGIVPMPSK